MSFPLPADQSSLNEGASLHARVTAALRAAALALGIEPAFEAIAIGGNGAIFRGTSGLGRGTAVKVPRYGAVDRSREAVVEKGLLREAEVLGAVRSAHLPPLFATDAVGRFLARGFVEGQTLERLAADAISDGQRLGLCEALLACAADLFSRFHDRPGGGYAIRDFKPRNLVRDERSGQVVLIDVGSVRAERGMLSNTRRPHRIGSGSWRYWAPEQLLEDASMLDRRVDYFALGGTLHYVLFREPAYRNHAPAERATAAYAVEYDELRRRVDAAVTVPTALRSALVRWLDPDPARRPASLTVRPDEAHLT